MGWRERQAARAVPRCPWGRAGMPSSYREIQRPIASRAYTTRPRPKAAPSPVSALSSRKRRARFNVYVFSHGTSSAMAPSNKHNHKTHHTAPSWQRRRGLCNAALVIGHEAHRTLVQFPIPPAFCIPGKRGGIPWGRPFVALPECKRPGWGGDGVDSGRSSEALRAAAPSL